MDVVIESCIFNNLSSLARACLRVCAVSLILLRQLLRLCFGATAFVIRGTAVNLEKNYPDIY